ncbi:MAG: efflux RND transporter periplasmic adaptor subunit [Prolixibacteraceae bacterium]|jgi:multidrug efflux pump subunit AcrA (membrane-fusion protein)|nr:efflux RND transporter periplasmic adaptor subunit [Prolixibacteraceae bacterium]
MKKRIILLVASLLVAAVIILSGIGFVKSLYQSEEVYTVKKGEIISTVSCIGEVKGGKASPINIPEVLKDWGLRVYEYKMVDMVQDGKMVNAGDYIAKLDESDLVNNMRNQVQEKEKVDADLRHAVLDSTVVLTAFREDITNLLLDLEYVKIDLEQSKYDSEAEQRKARMNYQKAEIALEKKRRDYHLEQNKLKIRIMRHESRVEELQKRIERYQEAINATRIVCTEGGLVMFEKDYSGKKYSKDSRLYIYMNGPIAVLPDMSTVLSLSNVKEIDVTKIHLNDSVAILVDALPDKKFSGRVVKIANMGEDHKNFDMKVFKVDIRFDFSDPELKPGMTCSNDIVFCHAPNVLVVPVETIFAENGQTFVFLKNGADVVRKPVKTGCEDSKNIAILEGLNEGDKILMYRPGQGQLAEL